MVDYEEIKYLVDIKELVLNLTITIINRPNLEDRLTDFEDKVLAGQLLLLSCLFKLNNELKT